MCKKSTFERDEIENLIESGGIFGLINKYKNNFKILKEIEGELNKVKKDKFDSYTNKMVFSSIKNVRHYKERCEKEIRNKRFSEIRRRKSQRQKLKAQFSH